MTATVVVLTNDWPSGGSTSQHRDERPFITRRIAGALAIDAEVTVVTPQGDRSTVAPDGAFTVHSLGHGVDPDRALQEALVVEALRAGGCEVPNATSPSPAERGERDLSTGSDWSAPGAPRRATLVDHARRWMRAGRDPWRGAEALFEALQPDLVVVAGSRHLGISELLDQVDAPVALLPFGEDARLLSLGLYDQLAARASVVLATSAYERAVLAQAIPASLARLESVGLFVPVHPGARREPYPVVDDRRYVLVLCPEPLKAPSGAATFARLLGRRRFPHAVVVSHPDALVLWERGVHRCFDPITRALDLWRLMAWAFCTVDLRPGRFLALTVIESLRYQTPVIVPDGGVAAAHARDGDGGLWFRDAAELIAAVELMAEPEVAEQLGRQGARYADAWYGSSETFVQRVRAATTITRASSTPKP